MVIKYRIVGGRKMFDKLEDLVKRLDEVMQELSEPDVVSDQNRFRNLMKEQNELAPIVEKYKEYKEAMKKIELDTKANIVYNKIIKLNDRKLEEFLDKMLIWLK